MRLNFLPHARERMEQRGISEEEVRATLEDPARFHLEKVRHP